MSRRISLGAESGQTMAEYAVVLSVLIIAVVASLLFFSGAVESAISDVADMVQSVS